MDLSLDESQQILVDTFSEMLEKECPTTHVRETEANRDKVAERQQHFRQQLNSNTRREIADWRVMKSFLADLDASVSAASRCATLSVSMGEVLATTHSQQAVR